VSKDRPPVFSLMYGSGKAKPVNLRSMPLEGHWQRTNTPLRRLTRRERNVVAAGLATTVVALLILVLVTAGDSRPGPAAGCIRAEVAGRTGAELVSGCGTEAVEICRRAVKLEGPQAETVLDACREQRIAF
jgi:hypothetical protein